MQKNEDSGRKRALPRSITKPMTRAQEVQYLDGVRKWMNSRGKTIVAEPLDAQTRTRYKHMFDQLDEEHSGLLKAADFVRALKFIGIRITEEEFLLRLQHIDENSDGIIDFNEFVNCNERAVFDTVGGCYESGKLPNSKEEQSSEVGIPFHLWIPAYLRRRDILSLMNTGTVPETMKTTVKLWSQYDNEIQEKEKTLRKKRRQKAYSRSKASRRLDDLRENLLLQARERRKFLKRKGLEENETTLDESGYVDLNEREQAAGSFVGDRHAGHTTFGKGDFSLVEAVRSGESLMCTEEGTRLRTNTRRSNTPVRSLARNEPRREQHLPPRMRVQTRIVDTQGYPLSFGKTLDIRNHRKRHLDTLSKKSVFPSIWGRVCDVVRPEQNKPANILNKTRPSTSSRIVSTHHVKLPRLENPNGIESVRNISRMRARTQREKNDADDGFPLLF